MSPTPGDADLRKFYDPKKVIIYWLKRGWPILAILVILALIANWVI